MERHSTNPELRALEEAFFAEHDARLLEQLRERTRREERRQALRQVVPHADDAALDQLLELGIAPSTILSLTLIPLVAVAWADGAVDRRERDAILAAAAERGVTLDSPARQLLESWLARRPDPQLIETWRSYTGAVVRALPADHRQVAREGLLRLAREVATAAGGFLGMASISAAERAVLEDLGRAFE